MKYFHFHSHCYLIPGALNDAVFDVFQQRVLWLNRSPQREIARSVESGKSVEETGLLFGERDTTNFAEFLEAMDYGALNVSANYPEKFRPTTFSGQEEVLSLHRPLRRIVLELSSRCPLDCSVCQSPAANATCRCACGKWRSEGFPNGEWLLHDSQRQLKTLLTCGSKHLLIQGGDPFMERAVLYEIVEKARSMGGEVSVQTPAVALIDEDFVFLARNDVTVIVPIFGDTAASHDGITRVAGSFQALQAALKKFASIGYTRLRARIILAAETEDRRKAVIGLLPSCGIHYSETHSFLPSDDPRWSRRKPSDFRVDSETFLRLARGHYCWQDEFAVALSGDVLPCLAARKHKIANLHEQSLPEILRAKRHFPFRSAGSATSERCGQCEFRYGCRSCSLAPEGEIWDRCPARSKAT